MSRKAEKVKNDLCFVPTPIEVEGPLPIRVIRGCWCRRANQAEVRKIKDASLLRMFPLHGMKYEHDVVVVDGPKPGQRHGGDKPLPRDKWRYYVITIRGDHLDIENLALAAS